MKTQKVYPTGFRIPAVGDTIKGFRYESPGMYSMVRRKMEDFTGLEGTVCAVDLKHDAFCIAFSDIKIGNFWYPIHEYYKVQREEKLNELGI